MARRTRKVKSDPGIVYILLVELEGKSLVKIGVTHRRIEDRVSEILVGVFSKYREFPYCKPKRFKTTTTPYKKETLLHKQFSEHRYTTSKKFGGSTEFFDVSLEEVVAAYDDLIVVYKPRKAKAKPKSKPGVFFSVNKAV